jgi:tubulin polyglutamylase TTLL4
MRDSGLARFCTREHEEDWTPDDIDLTSLSAEAEEMTFVRWEGDESDRDWKRSRASELRSIREQAFGADPLARSPGGRRLRRLSHRHTSHELYGIDIMLDEQLKAHPIAAASQRAWRPAHARIAKCGTRGPDPSPGIDLIDEHWASSRLSRAGWRSSGARSVHGPPVFPDFVIGGDYRKVMEIRLACPPSSPSAPAVLRPDVHHGIAFSAGR